MAIPETMRAVIVERPGGPEALRIVTRQVPHPDHGEVLIKVAAAGLNGADLGQRRGRYRMPPGTPDVLGLEASGEVVALGASVTQWRVGDKVAALLVGGGYAEYCAVPAVQCLPAPPRLVPRRSRRVAGMRDDGVEQRVRTGRAEAGRRAPRPWRRERHRHDRDPTGARARRDGLRHRRHARKNADAARRSAPRARINYREEDFVAVIERETNGAGVDVVLDMVGGDYLNRDLRIIAHGGRLVMIAFKQGSTVRDRLHADFRKSRRRSPARGCVRGPSPRRAASSPRCARRCGRSSTRAGSSR